jgi:hypothetical protein
VRTREPTAAHWLSIDAAARLSGTSIVTPRRLFERNALHPADMSVVSRLDEIVARKICDEWRTQLGKDWRTGAALPAGWERLRRTAVRES